MTTIADGDRALDFRPRAGANPRGPAPVPSAPYWRISLTRITSKASSRATVSGDIGHPFCPEARRVFGEPLAFYGSVTA
jgi:hypothetical protein